mgnify:CR=1 FL=1
MNMEKMKEVFSDEAFVKSLFELESAGEVQAALKEKGIEFSEEEIISIRDFLVKVEEGDITKEQLEKWTVQAEDGELSEKELEIVAGGIVLETVGFVVGCAIIAYAGVSFLTLSIMDAVERRW